jgi:hypothetical protein
MILDSLHPSSHHMRGVVCHIIGALSGLGIINFSGLYIIKRPIWIYIELVNSKIDKCVRIVSFYPIKSIALVYYQQLSKKCYQN